jgi:hypothetical protein
MNVFLSILLSFTFLFPVVSFALTADEAYKAIPHARTIFDLDHAVMPQDEKEFLNKIFELTDEALIIRVQTLQAFRSGNFQPNDYVKQYDDVLNQFRTVDVPPKLGQVHRQIEKAIETQKKFFLKWQTMGKVRGNIAGESEVQSASQNLHEAYSLLMSLYPNETDRNKEAFFNYLCALDFI